MSMMCIASIQEVSSAMTAASTVQITDKCPECLANQIDMQALTFNKASSKLAYDAASGPI